MKRHHSMGLLLVAAGAGLSLWLWPSRPISPPPAISIGRDSCARCERLMREPGFGGALKTQGGAVTRYDDLGCLALDWFDAERQGQTLIEEAWVESRSEGRIVEARAAHFVRGAAVKTPNGYGIVAFHRGEIAKTYALAYGAEVVRLEALRATLPELRARERALGEAPRAEVR